MISYINPICSITSQRAILFCCQQNCALPAFACSSQCLEYHHANHRTQLWTSIQEAIRLTVELPLSKADLQRLEKQEKHIQILIEQLKQLHQKHMQEVKRSKQSLRLKGTAQKIISSINKKTTSQVSGSDLAHFIKQLSNNEQFANKEKVNTAIIRRSTYVEQLLANLQGLVQQYKQRITDIPTPEQIPSKDDTFIKISPIIDIPNSSQVIIDYGVFTFPTETIGYYYPVFAQEPLKQGQCFEVDIIDAAYGWFAIGVANTHIRNSKDSMIDPNGMYIYSRNLLYCDGVQQKLNYKINSGDKVRVWKNGSNIQWQQNGKPLYQRTIPNYLRDTPLYPVCWIMSYSSQAQITSLRFV